MLVKRHLLSWIIMICLVSVHVLHPNVSKTTSIVLDYNDLFSICTFVTTMKVIHDINQDKTFCLYTPHPKRFCH
jgi:hypothetical protein